MTSVTATPPAARILVSASVFCLVWSTHRHLPRLCLQSHRPRYRHPSNRRLSSHRCQPKPCLHHHHRLPAAHAGTILLTQSSTQTPATSRRVWYSEQNDAACVLACYLHRFVTRAYDLISSPKSRPRPNASALRTTGTTRAQLLGREPPCRDHARSALTVRRPRQAAPQGP